MRRSILVICVLGCLNTAIAQEQPESATPPPTAAPTQAPTLPAGNPPPPPNPQQSSPEEQQEQGAASPPPAQVQAPPQMAQAGPGPGQGPGPGPGMVGGPAQGQWVYTASYGWIWLPYARNYTYVDTAGELAFSYAYYPSYGWTWLASPWVLGWGPRPWWGPMGYGGYYWHAHPWFRAGVYRPYVWQRYGRGPWGPRPISPVYAHPAPNVWGHPTAPAYRPSPVFHPVAPAHVGPQPSFQHPPAFNNGGFHGGGFHGGGGFHHR